MTTTAQFGPPPTPSGSTHSTVPRRRAERPTPSTVPRRGAERPTAGELLAELVPVIGVVPVAGPPAVFVLGPWLFLVLMLAAPFAFLVALVVAMTVAATVLAALTTAIVAAPYLLVLPLRRHRARHASIGATSAPAVAIESPRVAAS